MCTFRFNLIFAYTLFRYISVCRTSSIPRHTHAVFFVRLAFLHFIQTMTCHKIHSLLSDEISYLGLFLALFMHSYFAISAQFGCYASNRLLTHEHNLYRGAVITKQHFTFSQFFQNIKQCPVAVFIFHTADVLLTLLSNQRAKR